MWFCEYSLISKKPYDPFYYTVPAFSLLTNGKLHLAKDIYYHAPQYLSWTQTPIFVKALNLRKCCHSSIPFLPSAGAIKTPNRTREQCAGDGLGSLLSFESSRNFFFKEVDVCGLQWILIVNGTVKYQFFPLVFEYC